MHTQENQDLPAGSRWLKKRGRRGIAILLTLGILSLLLIMAMGFLFNSSTGRSVSIVNADAVRAKMLADSGLQRFVAMVERDFSTISEMNPGVGFYAPTAGDWAGRRYVATVATGGAAVEGSDSPLYASLAGIDFTPESLSTDAGLATNVQWVNVTSYKDISATAGEGTDSVVRVIGRYCLLGIDETGKIDPSAAVPAAAETAGGDTGVDFSEIFLGNAFSTTLTDAQSAEYYAGASVPKWDSWYHLLNGGVSTLATTGQFRVASQSIFPHSREIEGFADPTDTSVARHRFNLKQDLTTLGVSGILNAATLFDGGDASAAGLHFLSGGTMGVAQRQAIAANMIDYADADNAATTDVIAAPTYMGNEKVPYINELVFEAEHTDDGTNSIITVSAWPEFANIYNDDFSSATGRLYIQVRVSSTEEAAEDLILTKDYAGTDTFTGKAYTGVSLGGTAAASASHTYTSGTAHATLSSFTLEVVGVWFFSQGGAGFNVAELWDYAKPGTAAAVALNVGATKSRRVCFDVDDPRFNLASSEWSVGAWGGEGTGSTPDSSMGSKNTNCAEPGAGSGNDDEAADYMTTTTTAIELSTAYIRNAPFESLWELGCIHRGAAWQTLNLAKSTSTATLSGAYTDGDAHILDHVKLTTDEIVQGKLNANSKYEYAWRGLIGHINLGASYATCGTSGDRPVDVSNWTAGTDDTQAGYQIAQAIIAANGSYVNRGHIAAVAALSDTSAKPSGGYDLFDAQKEELVGKLAHHLTTRSNWYSLIVCAQAIQPELFAARAEIKVLAESKMLAVVYRDVFSGKTSVEHIQPLDD